jgi:hypothetical protein
MKTTIVNVLFGKGAAASLLLILGMLFVMGFACNTSNSDGGNTAANKSDDKTASSDDKSSDKGKGDVPSDAKLQTLAKQTLMDFNTAIQSDDFSDFHDTLSEPFQKQVSADKLGGVFHEFVEKKMSFDTAKDLDATFSPSPEITNDAGYKMLVLKGYYPTKPRKTNFEFKYINEDSKWKLSSIDVNTKDQ